MAWLKSLGCLGLVLCSGVVGLAVIWLAVFGMELTAVTVALQWAAVLVAAVVVAWRPRRVPFAVIGLVVALALVGWPAWLIPGLPDPIVEYQDEMEAMDAALAGGGSLGTRHAAGAYGLNLVMGLGGWALGYDEVAHETLILCLPPGGDWPEGAHLRCQDGCPEDCPDGPPPMRRYESDFALGSERVVEAVCAMVPGGAPGAAGPAPIELERRTVRWSMQDYVHDSARVGLALNSPLCIRGTARPHGDRWQLELVGSARVWYPAGGFRIGEGVLAWHGRPLYLQEGVYADLHDRGWLHPYGVEWSWTVMSDDERLGCEGH
jgi:hypothetical protein